MGPNKISDLVILQRLLDRYELSAEADWLTGLERKKPVVERAGEIVQEVLDERG